MRVTLVGPDDLGYWFLMDEKGNSFPLVESHEDHPVGASFLGWQLAEDFDHDETIECALEWLMDHSGDEFNAPKHVVEYFEQSHQEEDE